ncbi:DJ-1/PfpI family protein [Microlunatus speluncae]|uniref:DJ-1/PfpI family protein n=1 Tax=Microlunatus speluncae TaxID=2594267 RepID=UPI0012660E84|nr:DJ-1/PfpI family protein [Microlunatus speluncae]
MKTLRVIGAGLGLLASFLVLPAAMLGVGAISFERYRYAPPDRPAAVTATPPAHQSGRPTAVVVVGNGGANAADVLAPYEVLAATGAFNLYVVAPQRRPVTLLGGLDLVPDLSFAELADRLGGVAPDVTVVPEMPNDEQHDAPVVAWLRETAAEGLVLGVCSGARLVADAGLLDGRPATSHWYRLNEIAPDHPDVDWRRGVRYVDTGDVITTGGLLSSIDGALRVVERLVSEPAAAAAAEAVHWRGYSPNAPAEIPVSEITWSERLLHLLNLGYRSPTTTIGVLLTDGVGELELAAAFDPYAEIRSARTLAIGPATVRSRHGLTFLPRAGLDAIGSTGRLLVPGTDAAARHPDGVDAAAEAAGVPVAYLHAEPGFAFEPALRVLAATTDVPTARWAAKILEYAPADLELAGSAFPWSGLQFPIGLGVGGLVVAVGVTALVRRRNG